VGNRARASAWAKSPRARLPTRTRIVRRFCPPYGAATTIVD
jgi:hypothetical protein